MYFSISDVRNNKAVAAAVICAENIGERALLGERTEIVFDASVAFTAQQLKRHDMTVIAARILNADQDSKRTALQVGFSEMKNLLGSNADLVRFFEQKFMPQATIRFDGVGGISDDILLVRNRAALYGTKALSSRQRLGYSEPGHTQDERDFVAFLKSVHRGIEDGIEKGYLSNLDGKELIQSVYEACDASRDPQQLKHLQSLQMEATVEFAADRRAEIKQKYAASKVKSLDNDGSPTMH